MKFLEKDLEDIIMRTDPYDLGLRGFFIPDNRRRQVGIGAYGIADIVGWERRKRIKGDLIFDGRLGELHIHVYELKKDVINVDALLQGIGYCKGIQSYIRDHRGFNYRIMFSLHLVGSSIDLSTTLSYMPDLIKINNEFNVRFTMYKYEFDGIHFEEIGGYKLSDEGFVNKKR